MCIRDSSFARPKRFLSVSINAMCATPFRTSKTRGTADGRATPAVFQFRPTVAPAEGHRAPIGRRVSMHNPCLAIWTVNRLSCCFGGSGGPPRRIVGRVGDGPVPHAQGLGAVSYTHL